MLIYKIAEENSNDTYVNFQGDLDIEATELINEELLPKLLQKQIIHICFKEVPFVDSSGLGLLINLIKTLQEKNLVVTISNVREEVYEVFELLQLPEIIGEKVFV